LAFYELYRDTKIESNDMPKSKNVLDIWIMAKLGELIKVMTDNTEDYKLLEPVRAARNFIDDLSTWYLRRSRDRIKDGDIEAKQTIYFVFKTMARLFAPFAPFSAEDVWQKLKLEGDSESVHFSSWPETIIYEEKVIEEMKELREIVTLGLQNRQKAGIPVRQPLREITVKKYNLKEEYVSILKDELNIKNVKFEEGQELEVILDTNITEDLKLEGYYRELVRAIQDIRKKNELNPNDVITLVVKTDESGKNLVNLFRENIQKLVSAKTIEYEDNDGAEVKVADLTFVIKVVK